ncbi:hypothetical protein L6452_09827 [Arctium lappa]|uniref:Uncharacterized protein n=1 Tax=Arctium lappa TaxID=4217 RepID=A0ACB9DLL7_ARCLA|nr:hypothetical protein L6452_09827 [Arctium lappa]
MFVPSYGMEKLIKPSRLQPDSFGLVTGRSSGVVNWIHLVWLPEGSSNSMQILHNLHQLSHMDTTFYFEDQVSISVEDGEILKADSDSELAVSCNLQFRIFFVDKGNTIIRFLRGILWVEWGISGGILMWSGFTRRIMVRE